MEEKFIIEFIFRNGESEKYVSVGRPSQREKSYHFVDPNGIETEVLRADVRSLSVGRYQED